MFIARHVTKPRYRSVMSAKAKIGMVFGVFDGLHEGHTQFLKQALEYAQHLIIVVATDESVMNLKGRKPQADIQKRIKHLQVSFPDAEVIEGDDVMGSYRVIKKRTPEILLLGYDQSRLKEDIEQKVAVGLIPQ